MADIKPLNSSISDDDELANVLAGVKNEAAAIDTATNPPTSTETITAVPPTPALDFEQTAPVSAPTIDLSAFASGPIADITPAHSVEPVGTLPAPSITTPVASSPELESLKKETLSELRPLVGKLDLPADEKFDTLLLIIRSTDDQTLLTPAHEAAKSIADDARRASALLDIIKEIDYFSAKS